MAAESSPLPEVADVGWRPRVTAARLRRREVVWSAYTAAHVVPFVATAVLLVAVGASAAAGAASVLAYVLAAVCLVHAWVIPALYAQRGANVLRPYPARGAEAERVAAGLLGDLVSHVARDLYARSGLVTERGGLGTWVVGPSGAVLVRPGGRRADCWCVRVAEPELPGGDRVAHLLLALRADEAGFATVANLAFSGAAWRVRRRLRAQARPALTVAARGPR